MDDLSISRVFARCRIDEVYPHTPFIEYILQAVSVDALRNRPESVETIFLEAADTTKDKPDHGDGVSVIVSLEAIAWHWCRVTSDHDLPDKDDDVWPTVVGNLCVS